MPGTPNTHPDLPSARLSLLRTGLRVMAAVAFAVLLHLLIDRVMDWTAELQSVQARAIRIALLAVILLTYALLIAVPFMPGVEIGISVLMLQGPAAAPFVWGATVLGLYAAFLAGLWLPYGRLHAILADLRLRRACRLVDRLEEVPTESRLRWLDRHLPPWLRPLVVRHRYVLLGLLINLPGNALIGGGGGIALLSGLSRLYAPRTTLLTFAIACAPVPLMIWYWDIDIARITGFGR